MRSWIRCHAPTAPSSGGGFSAATSRTARGQSPLTGATSRRYATPSRPTGCWCMTCATAGTRSAGFWSFPSPRTYRSRTSTTDGLSGIGYSSREDRGALLRIALHIPRGLTQVPVVFKQIEVDRPLRVLAGQVLVERDTQSRPVGQRKVAVSHLGEAGRNLLDMRLGEVVEVLEQFEVRRCRGEVQGCRG